MIILCQVESVLLILKSAVKTISFNFKIMTTKSTKKKKIKPNNINSNRQCA